MAAVEFFHLTRRHWCATPPGFFALSPARGHLKVGGLDVIKHLGRLWYWYPGPIGYTGSKPGTALEVKKSSPIAEQVLFNMGGILHSRHSGYGRPFGWRNRRHLRTGKLFRQATPPVRRMTRLKTKIVTVVFFIVLLLDKIPQFWGYTPVTQLFRFRHPCRC